MMISPHLLAFSGSSSDSHSFSPIEKSFDLNTRNKIPQPVEILPNKESNSEQDVAILACCPSTLSSTLLFRTQEQVNLAYSLHKGVPYHGNHALHSITLISITVVHFCFLLWTQLVQCWCSIPLEKQVHHLIDHHQGVIRRVINSYRNALMDFKP